LVQPDEVPKNAALGNVRFIPRALSISVTEAGKFSILADAGVFNLSIRPDPDLGFPWWVRPLVDVSAGVALGSVSVGLPMRYSGEITSDDVGTVGDALIRAYAYIDDAGQLVDSFEQATSLVAVGEARSDSSGHFVLRLPRGF
jgi:hypothetical protein